MPRAKVEKEAEEQDGGATLTFEQLKDLMVGVAEGSSRAMHKELRPSNPTFPDVSAYNPLGERDHPRPDLTRPTYFCGGEQRREWLTREEIDAFNAIKTDCVAKDGRWTARIQRDNSGQPRLFVNVPHRGIDQRAELPPLLIILRELVEGPELNDIEMLRLKVQELEKQVVRNHKAPVEVEDGA
jgi:hypothetical protein